MSKILIQQFFLIRWAWLLGVVSEHGWQPHVEEETVEESQAAAGTG